MLNFSYAQRIRHLIKRLPYAEDFYNFLNTVFSPTYTEDGMRVTKNCAFLHDPSFNQAYDALLKQAPGTKTRWRAHITQWAGFYASKLRGDFVETGVYKAAFSSSIISYINFQTLTDRKFYLFDTYSGLVEDLISPNEGAAYKHDYEDTYQFVIDSFKAYPNVIIVRGIVPDSLATVDIRQVAYLSVDMNSAKPERAALEHFWPKLVDGGIVVLDDYLFPGRELQQESADEFAESVGTKILSVPTGQGILIKI
ncbi:MAG: class I SAM-dependent methyltransferase [candidate division Zixibacteria bacterium]|nr:class I SAM-dependent methyltransferase [candidate division Zixibacteria bacterium]